MLMRSGGRLSLAMREAQFNLGLAYHEGTVCAKTEIKPQVG